MRKKLLTVITLLSSVVLLSACSAASVSVDVDKAQSSYKSEAVVVSNSSAKSDKVLESRFLNMLNHNNVYNDDFYSDEELINNSIISLLDLRDRENDSYINEAYVKDFVFNMYGKIYNDFSAVNAEFPQLEGYVYIVPRGYSEYTHEIVSVTLNLDGSYTVVTNVTCDAHDDAVQTLQATTLFVKNSESQFGFNILYSEISSSNANTAAC